MDITPRIPMPSALDAELSRMRRDPREFTITSVGKCKLCKPKTKTAYSFSHPLNEKGAGAWCEIHGILAFDSVKIRPRGEEYIPKRKAGSK